MRLGFYVTGSADSTYAEILDQISYAEASGFDSVWLRERHFHRDHGGRNFFCSPMLVAANVAARTERIRIGIGARILPLDHPLRIAEDAATVDLISGGRLDLGIARVGENDLYEAGFGVDRSAARERFTEAVELLLKAWSGGPIEHAGPHFPAPRVAVAPRPAQRPHPPLYLVGLSDETLRFGAERAMPLLLAAAQPEESVARARERYLALVGEEGHGPVATPLNRFVYVGETTEAARAEVREEIVAFVTRSRSVIRDFLGLSDEEVTPERLMEDVFIVGDSEECARRIEAIRERMDPEELILTFNYFTLSGSRCRASMERFVEQVAPALARPPAVAVDG